MKGEIHDFIIWEKACHKYNFLLSELKKQFCILDVYEITWEVKNFEKNLRRFYGPTLPNVQKKIRQCGTGKFLLVIYYDPIPKHQFRKTSLGMQMTNVNVYDKKRELRKNIDGEFPIHGSIHEKEANHDLTLILGKNAIDLQKKVNQNWDGGIKKIKSDLFGTNGWDDINDVFYLLNSTTNYVILRNFEKYPEEITSDIHPDIDILVDDIIHLPYLLNQVNVVEKREDSPYVIVENKKIKFDYRYAGDTYYDEKWANDILKRRKIFKNSFFVPNDEDYFYSLLYHCFIHGAQLSKYKSRLTMLANSLNILHLNDKPESELKKLLDNFMEKNKYTYTTSPKYKIKHNELIRMSKLALFTLKHEGVLGLLRAINNKIKRKIVKKNVSTN